MNRTRAAPDQGGDKNHESHTRVHERGTCLAASGRRLEVKVKAARKAAKSESSDKDTSPAVAAEAAPDTSKRDKSSQVSKKAASNGKASKASRPDLEALARGLPAGWRPMYDKASSSVYYGNLSTKVAPDLSLAWGCHRPHNSSDSDLANFVWLHTWLQGSIFQDNQCLGLDAPVVLPNPIILRAWANPFL